MVNYTVSLKKVYYLKVIIIGLKFLSLKPNYVLLNHMYDGHGLILSYNTTVI